MPFQAEMIALLGHRDSPTDGVEDYCVLLDQALQKQGRKLELVRVPWQDLGWVQALRQLWHQSSEWKGRWVLAQYTALSWSRRGFPLNFLTVVGALKLRGARVGIVFHDPGPCFPLLARGFVGHVRSAIQRLVMRMSYGWADKSILTVSLELADWLPAAPAKASFIPVGANVPARRELGYQEENQHGGPKTVAIFGVTGGGAVPGEVEDIAFALREAAKQMPAIRLVTLGRGSKEAEAKLRQALGGTPVELAALGILPAEEVSRVLSAADAMLFVRAHLTTQRGSAIAGIACELPLVAYAGHWTGPPVTEAGVLLVPQGNREELAKALIHLLVDDVLREELRKRNSRAWQQHFSWSAIAQRLVLTLAGGSA
jgi:glycosyltransferase involved in cell wall biosynthesis